MSETLTLSLRKTVLVSFDVEPVDVLRSLSDAEIQTECERRGLLPRPTDAIDGAALRAARGLLDWSLADLAAASRVSVSTIKRIEDVGIEQTRPAKLDLLRRALWDAGLRFTAIGGAVGVHRVSSSRSN